jgi:hypothetical protein
MTGRRFWPWVAAAVPTLVLTGNIVAYLRDKFTLFVDWKGVGLWLRRQGTLTWTRFSVGPYDVTIRFHNMSLGILRNQYRYALFVYRLEDNMRYKRLDTRIHPKARDWVEQTVPAEQTTAEQAQDAYE